MLEIIGNANYLDFLPDCFDVAFVDAPSGKCCYLYVEDDCHADAIQLYRCLNEMTDESALILPYVTFHKYRPSGHLDILKNTRRKLAHYADIGIIDTNTEPGQYNVIYNPLVAIENVKEFHCDYVLIYGKEY